MQMAHPVHPPWKRASRCVLGGCVAGAVLVGSGCTAAPRTAAPAKPAAPPAPQWARVLEGEGFAVWCDADGNARLVTDAPPRVQDPLPDNAVRRQMFLVRAIRTDART